MATFEDLSIVTGRDDRGRIFGTAADELAPGTNGDDRINLRAGNDILFGQGGNDLLVGLAGADILFGGIGSDELIGGLGSDTVNGGAGNDLVIGRQDNDVIRGGDGDDIVAGSTGDDVMIGGSGLNLYFFDPSRQNEGRDRITDFKLGSDKIAFTVEDFLASDPGLEQAIIENGGDVNAVFAALEESDTWSSIAAPNGDAIIQHPNGTIRLQGVAAEGDGQLDLKPAFAIAGLGEKLTSLAEEAGNPATVADVVAASGTGFDDNETDFDILRVVLEDTGLASALADEDASLSVVAPVDAAFISLARELGYEGSSESGALVALFEALAPLGGGDPLGPLTDILSYHVAAGARTLGELQAERTIATLFDDTEFTVDEFTIVDNDPDFEDATIVGEDVQTGNGVIQVVNEVLLPFEV